jgi:integrase/recombinase XerD
MQHVTDAVLVTASTHRTADQCELAKKAFLIRYRNPGTRRCYEIAVDQWFSFCREFGVDPMRARGPHVEGFARSLEASGRGPATVASKINVLSVAYKVWVHDEFADRDPTVMVERPNVDRTSKSSVFTRGELVSMIEAAKACPRDHALVAVLAHTGMRINELLQIDIEDVSEIRGQLTVEVTRKGGKRQLITFAPETGWIVRNYLASLDRTTGPFFLTRAGNRMDRKSAGRIVKRTAKAAGVSARAHPHAFRKTMATLSRNAGIPDREIQAAGGWSDSRMVSYYDGGKETLQANATTALTVFIDRAA